MSYVPFDFLLYSNCFVILYLQKLHCYEFIFIFLLPKSVTTGQNKFRGARWKQISLQTFVAMNVSCSFATDVPLLSSDDPFMLHIVIHPDCMDHLNLFLIRFIKQAVETGSKQQNFYLFSITNSNNSLFFFFFFRFPKHLELVLLA